MIGSFACNARSRSSRAGRGGAALVALVTAVLFLSTPARATVNVVTTTPSLEDIVRQIGGKYVTVQSVMRGPENVHNVQAKPSHMMKVRRADLFVHSGLDGELWAPLLVKGARNPKVLPGRPGNVDVSRGIQLLEVPGRAGLTRALGDIHAYGNTHFSLDPMNGIIIARTITNALKTVDGGHASEYEASYEIYAQRLMALTDRLVARIAPYRGTNVVVYHRSWPYFLARFGLVGVDEVEPKPGISPGPQHLAEVIDAMKATGTKVVIVETYNSKAKAEFVADKAGGRAVVLAQEVRAVPGVTTYEQMFEYDIDALLTAFRDVGVAPRPVATGAEGGAGSDAAP